MERVQTFTNSPYVGTMQYKDAGPNKIHQKIKWPFMLPASPYLGSIRHDIPLLSSLMLTAIQPTYTETAMQTKPDMRDVAVQTEVDLRAYLINDYDLKSNKQDS